VRSRDARRAADDSSIGDVECWQPSPTRLQRGRILRAVARRLELAGTTYGSSDQAEEASQRIAARQGVDLPSRQRIDRRTRTRAEVPGGGEFDLATPHRPY